MDKMIEGMRNLTVEDSRKVNKDDARDITNINALNKGMKNLIVKDLVKPTDVSDMEEGMSKLKVRILDNGPSVDKEPRVTWEGKPS